MQINSTFSSIRYDIWYSYFHLSAITLLWAYNNTPFWNFRASDRRTVLEAQYEHFASQQHAGIVNSIN